MRLFNILLPAVVKAQPGMIRSGRPNTLMCAAVELPKELQEVAFEEFGETEELRTSQLLALREEINQLPEIDRLTDTGDVNLIRFLRSRKFDIEKALHSTVQWQRFYKKYEEVLHNITNEGT
jgi:hypothetical protein